MMDLSPLYDAIAKLVPLDCMKYEFAPRAMVALVLLAPMCAAMGVQVVNFRMAFFSDAISHSAFTGVAIGLILGTSQHLTMVALAVLIGLGIAGVSRRTSLSTDTVIGVFFSAAVAFGLAVVSRDRSVARDVQRYLLGDILTISDAEVVALGTLFVALMAFQAFGYNRLLYTGLNASLASAHRIRVRGYQYVFAAILSLVVIFSVWSVGVLLVTALLIVPAAAARNFANSAGGMFWWAVGVGLASAVAGLLISLQPWADTAAGATVVLVACALFAISAVVSFFRRQRG